MDRLALKKMDDHIDTELDLLNKIIQQGHENQIEIRQTQQALIEIQKHLRDIEAAVKTTVFRYFMHKIKQLMTLPLPKSRLRYLNQYPSRPFSTHSKAGDISFVLRNPPTISIVTPSFNQASFLEKTIVSVLSQYYPSLQYIIQDGGSTDGSHHVLETYKHAFAHCESKKDHGQSHALNLGFKHASGEIMAYLNSDDVLMSGTLHYVADYFSKHPEVDVVYGHRIIINEYDQEIGRWVLPPHDDKILSWADFIPQETLFWRRRIWEKSGGFIDENFRFAMDWDLILRFREAGAVFARLPRFLGAFRIHHAQKTSTLINDVGKKEMDKLRFRCLGIHHSPAEISINIKAYERKHILYHFLYRLGILRY